MLQAFARRRPLVGQQGRTCRASVFGLLASFSLPMANFTPWGDAVLTQQAANSLTRLNMIRQLTVGPSNPPLTLTRTRTTWLAACSPMLELHTSTAWGVIKLPSRTFSIAYSATTLLPTRSARLLLPGLVPWEPLCPVASRFSITSSILWADSTPSPTGGREPTRSGSLLLLPRGCRSPLFCLFR